MSNRTLSLGLFFISLVMTLPQAALGESYESVKAQAEKFYSQGSYAQTNKIYRQAQKLRLTKEQSNWVSFRLADTKWRQAVQSRRSDRSKIDAATSSLETLLEKVGQKNRLFADINESLGDRYWTPLEQRNWYQASPYYTAALNWWASQDTSETARQRYLSIIWRISKPPHARHYYYYGYHGNIISLELINNAIKLARTSNEKAHANYLLGMTLHRHGHRAQASLAKEAFEKALKLGKETDWYDDALFHYAELAERRNTVTVKVDGHDRHYPDYVEAVKLYRRLAREFGKGETRYYDQAKSNIKAITEPKLSASVSNAFYPGSEIQYQINFRNVSQVSFDLYKVSLTSDVKFVGSKNRGAEWIKEIQLSSMEPLRSWSYDTKDQGKHIPRGKQLSFDEPLPEGAYIIKAQAGRKEVRELILVSSVSTLLHASGKKALLYFADAETGAPRANANVVLWEQYRHQGSLFGRNVSHYAWHKQTLSTDKDGLAHFELRNSESSSYIYAAAQDGPAQAFSVINNHYHQRNSDRWKVYVYTDRPAYRPEDSVNWKVVARYHDGHAYSTPNGQKINYEITDPRDTSIRKGSLTLNSFGSAWDDLELGKTLPLGEYRIAFRNENNSHIGGATFFRLEEYKLPEYKVSVSTPKEEGKRKTFRLGESVDTEIKASYYFGGAVAKANVEVVVYQKPFYHHWSPSREYPWLFNEQSSHYRHRHYGPGQVIKRETLTTDANGIAKLSFDTPKGTNQDYEFKIEARVTDSSRREIIGSDHVRVTQKPFFVYPRAKHNIYGPKDKVEIEFKALDANSQGISKSGTVTVTRNHHIEVWKDPKGREYKGKLLEKIKKDFQSFPPQVNPDKPDERWRLVKSGYEHEEILSESLSTDSKGEATFTFTPQRDGYYSVKWSSDIGTVDEVVGDTTVWVADSHSTEFGYRKGGLEIIADKDSFKVGETAPVMLHTPTSNRYVLFLVEGEELYQHQLVHLTGTVKLLNIKITDEHVPNIFLNASMIHSGRLHQDNKDIVVPPTKHFLDVSVAPDKEQYEPGQKGRLTITAKDHQGNPAAAELGVALFDESVLYIQQEYANDPRQFFYADKRHRRSTVQTTLRQKRYVRLLKQQDGSLISSYDLRRRHVRKDGALGLVRDKEPAINAPSMTGAVSEMAAADSFGGTVLYARKSKRAPAPQEAAAPMRMEADDAGGAGAGSSEANVEVRTNFSATALWLPDVQTDINGKATVEVTYPDSLTTWKASVRAASTKSDFGIGSTSTKTNKDLIVRLQAPRFFVVGDEVTISGVINNNSDKPMQVSPAIKADGLVFASNNTSAPVQINAGSERRIDWKMLAKKAGPARIRVVAKSSTTADAMEKTYQIHQHGIDKLVVAAGKLKGNIATASLRIPKERKADSTEVSIQVSPSLAITMLDSLPYLIDYPYGCTEQTMSRFLPTLIALKTLADLGMNPQDAAERVFGGIEREHVAKTQTSGKKSMAEMRQMTVKGLKRLYDFQHSDGGWGWWKEGDSDHYMSAYVLWGLSLAKRSGVDIRQDVMSRANEFLNRELVEEEEHPDMQAWMLHAVAAYQYALNPYAPKRPIDQFQQKAFSNLWNRRDTLNAYTRALFALAAHYFGKANEANILVENLENGVIRDSAPDSPSIQQVSNKSNSGMVGTAHWGEDGLYWRWSEGGVEATAFALRALLAINPKHELIEPTANWLIKNRRGAQWSNTRDTAIVVLALNDYLKSSGELTSNISYAVQLNGTTVAQKKVTQADILSAPSVISIDPKLIKDGDNIIRIVRKDGTGPLYYSAQAKYFSLEEPIPAEGHELFVRREYYKITPKETLLNGYREEKTLIEDGAELISGDRVEVVVVVESKNNYEYLVFEDLKPAGLEAVQLKSGELMYARQLREDAVQKRYGSSLDSDSTIAKSERFASDAKPEAAVSKRPFVPETPQSSTELTGQSRWVYQELRDRKVAMFIDKLPQGVWEMCYELRAEVPGKFHALPLLGHAMYVPEIKANSKELRIVVADRESSSLDE